MEDTKSDTAAWECAEEDEDEPVSLARTFGEQSLVREIIETVLLTAIVFVILNTATGRFRVRGSSMEPTLFDGQYLLVGRVTYWIQEPRRGDIVVFRPPNSAGEDYVKRIVGIPGDRVEARSGQLWVNGDLLDEPYVTGSWYYTGFWTVDDGEYFLLGDNRANSSDSHNWGTLPAENIIGEAWLCYWPPDDWGVVRHYELP